MDGISIQTTVDKLSYMFHLNGDIVPILNIQPALVLPDGSSISKFPLLGIESDVYLPYEKGTRVEIVIPLDPEEKPFFNKVDHLTDLPPIAYCPVCGSVLFAPESPLSVGRCINRGCSAQLSVNLPHMLEMIGMPWNIAVKNVLNSVITRGLVSSPDKIFTLDMEALMFPYLTFEQIQYFLYTLHNLRGRVSFEQILKGMRVPGWDEEDYQEYLDEEIFHMSPLTLKQCVTLCGEPSWENTCISSEQKNVIDTFMSLEGNRHMANNLAMYLSL